MSESALLSRGDGRPRSHSARPVEDRHSPALATMGFLLLYVMPSLFGWWLILVCLRRVIRTFAGLLS